MKHVAIFGGGIAGLTAAHELLTRGFRVSLFEAAPTLGGLARTQWHQLDNVQLPGEHGFRLFPSFYQHTTNTMSRTPARPGSERTVADHLRSTRVQGVAFEGDKLQSIRFERTLPRSSEAISRAITRALFHMRLDPVDMYRFQMKMVQYMTSCSERRLAEYERLSWWDYLEGDRYTQRFQRYLNSVPRALVAMDARRSDARTQSNVLLQHMLDHLSAGKTVDRVLDGPTSPRWIDPWARYLVELGAVIHTRVRLEQLETDGRGRLLRAHARDLAGDRKVTIEADYFITALPIRPLRGLITEQHAEEDAVYGGHGNLSLGRLRSYPLERALALLSGIQFYLDQDVSIIPGHVFLPDSAWGLSLVSQAQFWGDDFRRRWGGGRFGGIISVDIANFDAPFEVTLEDGRRVTLRAAHCTFDQLARGVWQQILRAFDAPAFVQRAAMQVIDDERIELREWRLPEVMPPYHVDELLAGGPNQAEVLINPPSSFGLRPGPIGAYGIHLGKLAMAGNYMQTYTSLPTMESANESGRHAVNAILDHLDHPAERCTIWPLEGAEPRDLDMLKDLDRELHRRSQPHFLEILGIDALITSFLPRGASLSDADLQRLISTFFPAASSTQGGPRRARPFDPLSDQLAALGQLFRMGVR